jgi:hypothetical protein
MPIFLLTSIATLGFAGAALAQAPTGPVGAPMQGQSAYPMAPAPTAYVNNNNNNYQAPPNPTPGTMVLHLNGKVQALFQAGWTSGSSNK